MLKVPCEKFEVNQNMAFDIDDELRKARKRLHAQIFGHEQLPIVIEGGPTPSGTRVFVGEYEITGVTSADIELRPDSLTTIHLEILVGNIRVSGIK